MRDLVSLETRASEPAELRTRPQLTEQTQSTIEEERNRLAENLRQAEEEAETLRKELEAERSKGFWHRLFGG